MNKLLPLLSLSVITAAAQDISGISFSVGIGGEGVLTAPTATELAILTDGVISNASAGSSILISPTSDATVDLLHQFTIDFTAPSDISSFELFSDFRVLDAYVTLADIEFFDGLGGTGTSVGGAMGLVFDAPSTPDPDGLNSWINPISSVSQDVSATGASSAVLTIQAVNELTSSGEGGYQLREISFNASPVPEPSSTALLGLSGLALLARRKRA